MTEQNGNKKATCPPHTVKLAFTGLPRFFLFGSNFQVKQTYLAENMSLPSYIVDLEEGKIHYDISGH